MNLRTQTLAALLPVALVGAVAAACSSTGGDAAPVDASVSPEGSLDRDAGPSGDASARDADATLPPNPPVLDATPPQESGVVVLDPDAGRDAGPEAGPVLARKQRLAFASDRAGNFDVYIGNPDGTDLVQITTDPASDTLPSWSNDGRRLAFTSSRSGTRAIYVFDLDTLVTSPVPVTGLFSAGSAAFAVDGKSVIVEGQTDVDAGTALYQVDVAGGAPTPIAAGAGLAASPVVAPDGTLYFMSTRDGQRDIFAQAPDAGAPRRITTNAGVNGRFGVSSDQKTLVYASPGAGGAVFLHLFSVDTGEVRDVSPNEESEPSFVPSSQDIVFATRRFGGEEIASIGTVTLLGIYRLTTSTALNTSPAISPP